MKVEHWLNDKGQTIKTIIIVNQINALNDYLGFLEATLQSIPKKKNWKLINKTIWYTE